MRTATFLHNVLPHSALKGSTPSRTMFPNGRDYIQQGGKLYTFGCLAYRWIHQERRNIQRASKFAPNSERLVFTGYDASDNNLMVLLDPKTDRIYREKNVKIVENVLPFCERAKCGPCKCPVKERTESPVSADHELILNLQMPIHEYEDAVVESEGQLSAETAVKSVCDQSVMTVENEQTSASPVSERTQHLPPAETSDSSLHHHTIEEIAESETENGDEAVNNDEMTVEEEETQQSEEFEKDDPPKGDDEPDDSWVTEKQEEKRQKDAYNLRDRSQLKPPDRLTYLIQGPSGETQIMHHQATAAGNLNLGAS
ncbi:hypothetical protein TYRP_014787 [Tyrophagus putrescentiae]|nr:hypothetical protein TYRP_014787 [Tyrophagus putrescentiae]